MKCGERCPRIYQRGVNKKMKKKSFLREENGASAVEYAMLIGLISLYSFAAYRALSKVTYLVIKNMWSQLTKAGG